LARERRTPPFRADHIGSLLRPDHLIEAREKYRAGEIDRAALTAVEDKAVREVVAMQEEIGLQSVTDGEFRRRNYIIDFYLKALGRGGIGFEPGDLVHRNDRGETLPTERMVVKAKVNWPGPIFVDHFAFLKSATTRTPKITLPSPLILHFLGGNEAVLRDAYSSLDDYWSDLIDVYAKEMAALGEAGCRYLQIDETSLVKFGDPEIRSILEARGEDWRTLAGTYVEVLNEVFAAAPEAMAVGMHVCRGNRLGYWQADTGYEPMAEFIFERAKAPFYLLEFDGPRAGSLGALRLIPEDRIVVLGLVTTKSPQVEDPDFLRRRIGEATKYIPLERLCLSPQCGFSGDARNRAMNIGQEKKKLRLVVETARSVWGPAD
jgi:5-methyltetrahydropteroyltriglutamate--homocysteine methyltransferase